MRLARPSSSSRANSSEVPKSSTATSTSSYTQIREPRLREHTQIHTHAHTLQKKVMQLVLYFLIVQEWCGGLKQTAHDIFQWHILLTTAAVHSHAHAGRGVHFSMITHSFQLTGTRFLSRLHWAGAGLPGTLRMTPGWHPVHRWLGNSPIKKMQVRTRLDF